MLADVMEAYSLYKKELGITKQRSDSGEPGMGSLEAWTQKKLTGSHWMLWAGVWHRLRSTEEVGSTHSQQLAWLATSIVPVGGIHRTGEAGNRAEGKEPMRNRGAGSSLLLGVVTDLN